MHYISITIIITYYYFLNFMLWRKPNFYISCEIYNNIDNNRLPLPIDT